MKVLDYALNALAAATDVAARHPRQRAAVSYPTLGFSSPHVPHGPIRTPTATTYATLRPTATHHVIPAIRARNVSSNNQPPDLSKVTLSSCNSGASFASLRGLIVANKVQPMLGLYSEDQVTTETTTFENGIDSSKWIVDTRQYGGAEYNPYMRKMDPENVKVEDGLLKLTVPGGQKYDPDSKVGLSSAQIMTAKKMSIGSLEMKVKMSSVEGTCQCGFLYGADNNEVDMEYLTRTKVSWAVVQGMGREQPIQQVDLNVTTDQTDGWHTYKLVRTETKAYWIVDGQLVNVFDKNIPTEPVQMMVAHW